jgi:hypothetical protein
MNLEDALKAEEALDLLDTYQYPKLKEVAQVLRNFLTPMIENDKAKQMKAKHSMRYTYQKWNPQAKVDQTIEFFINAIKLYEEAAENLIKTNNAQQDILHALEMLDNTEEEMIEYAKQLHEIRKIRREANDFTDIMLPVYDFASKYQHLTDELKKIKSGIDTQIKFMETRKYNIREKKELTDKFGEKALVRS